MNFSALFLALGRLLMTFSLHSVLIHLQIASEEGVLLLLSAYSYPEL
jgi:hypothetical protein